MSLRKVTKPRSSFPNDEAVLKLLYLALRNIAKRWTMPIHEWKAARGSLRDNLRRPNAGRLKKRGLWKPWKNEEHFPTVPTAPTTTK